MSADEKKEYLQRYVKLNQEAQRQAEELMQLRSLAEKCTPVWSDAPKGSPEGGSLERTIERIVELEQELNGTIDSLLIARRQVEEAIQTVQDSTLRLLLRYRYLNGLKWEDVADKMGYGLRQVMRLHIKALKKSILS